MWLFKKVRTRLVDFFGNAAAGIARMKSKQDPASGLSPEISENRGTAPEHNGKWLINLGARTQREILLHTRDGDRPGPA